MANSADPDQLIWIYTVCKGRVYQGSAGQGSRLKIKEREKRSGQPTNPFADEIVKLNRIFFFFFFFF